MAMGLLEGGGGGLTHQGGVLFNIKTELKSYFVVISHSPGGCGRQ